MGPLKTIPWVAVMQLYLVEETLVVQGLSLGPHIGLAQRNLLTDVTLAVARELGLLVPVRVLGLEPPLALPLSPSLFPARAWLMVRPNPLIPCLFKLLEQADLIQCTLLHSRDKVSEKRSSMASWVGMQLQTALLDSDADTPSADMTWLWIPDTKPTQQARTKQRNPDRLIRKPSYRVYDRLQDLSRLGQT